MKEKIFTLLEIVEKSVAFNKSLDFPELKNVYLATDSKVLLEIFMMRSRVYKELGFDKLYPDTIDSFNFDKYDTHSAILYTKFDGKITGTCRLILDQKYGLPMEHIYSNVVDIKEANKKLAELSRLLILKKQSGLGQEPKLLTRASYEVMKANGITTLISAMVPKHYDFYKNFGGFEVKDKLQNYGPIQEPFHITSWEISKVSPFFKRLFLKS